MRDVVGADDRVAWRNGVERFGCRADMNRLLPGWRGEALDGRQLPCDAGVLRRRFRSRLPDHVCDRLWRDRAFSDRRLRSRFGVSDRRWLVYKCRCDVRELGNVLRNGFR